MSSSNSKLSSPDLPGGNRIELDPASFSVSARVALQLGRESISNSNTAIVELVKNSYDADAENVLLRFAKLGTPEASLLIVDDGIGMSETELRDYWFLIGTANKKHARRSRNKKRVQTGEKGLGRLGLDRLSSKTILQTLKKEDSSESQEEMFNKEHRGPIELTIEWGKYEQTSKRLEVIEHSLSALEHLDFDPISHTPTAFPHGTRIIMQNLTEEWTEDKIKELREELSLLLSPFGSLEDFNVVLETEFQNSNLNGVICPDPNILNLANWKVTAAINKTTSDQEEVTIRMTSTSHDRAYLFGPEPWEKFSLHSTDIGVPASTKSRCGPAKLTFYVFIRESNLPELKNFMDANQGIRVYRDGFRVKPFGDPAGEHDWLRLSMRRARNPAAISRSSWSVAYHQVVGAVIISRDSNPELSDQTNREGIVEGPAFDDLRLFATKSIQYFEGRAHEDYVALHPKKEKPQKEDYIGKVTTAINELSDSPSSKRSEGVNKALKELDKLKQSQKQLLKEEQQKVKDLENERVLLTSLASLGVMTACFGHERVNDTTEVLNHAARLKQHIENPQKSLFSAEESLEMLDALLLGAQRVEAFAAFSLNHVRPWKRRTEPVEIISLIEGVIEVFSELLVERYRIDVTPDWKENSELLVPGWIAGWESVFVNFFSNSCWALEHTLAKDRFINIKVGHENDMVMITFEDSGRGIEAGTHDDIFRPGFSTKRDHHNHQIGTGMGLALVSSYLKAINGHISVCEKSKLGGAKFKILIKESI